MPYRRSIAVQSLVWLAAVMIPLPGSLAGPCGCLGGMGGQDPLFHGMCHRMQGAAPVGQGCCCHYDGAHVPACCCDRVPPVQATPCHCAISCPCRCAPSDASATVIELVTGPVRSVSAAPNPSAGSSSGAGPLGAACPRPDDSGRLCLQSAREHCISLCRLTL